MKPRLESNSKPKTRPSVSLQSEQSSTSGWLEKLRKLEPQAISMGMKDVIELPSEKIEERLGLSPGEGAANVFVGSPTGGLRGGGFLYTNKDSLALGMVVGADDVSIEKVPSHSLMEKLR